MEVNFTEFPTIFFLIISDTISALGDNLGDNFVVAISTAFLGAIFFTVFPITSVSAGFAWFLKTFLIYFTAFYIIGYTSTFLIDTQPSRAELNEQLRLDYIERNCGYPLGTFP